MTEDEYKKKLISLLEADFDLYPEHKGVWPTGETVYLDFLCKPKQHVIDQGFKINCFAVEVKSPDTGSEAVKKLLDGVIQSYTYTLCDFNGERPAFTLIYPDVRMFFQKRYPGKYVGQHSPSEESDVDILRRVMQRANVGEIVEEERVKYEFRFSRSRMYDPIRGVSNVENLGSLRRIGSRKIKA